jgi:putative oxidoreductase
MTAVITLIGRIMLATIFILSGISKIGSHDTTVAYMQAHGIPAAPFFLYAAVLVEIAGGFCVATGFRARLGALLLAAFLVPTTYLFHFRPAFDAQMMMLIDKNQLINVLKNLAIMGGLLLIYGNGAGKITLGKDS